MTNLARMAVLLKGNPQIVTVIAVIVAYGLVNGAMRKLELKPVPLEKMDCLVRMAVISLEQNPIVFVNVRMDSSGIIVKLPSHKPVIKIKKSSQINVLSVLQGKHDLLVIIQNLLTLIVETAHVLGFKVHLERKIY